MDFGCRSGVAGCRVSETQHVAGLTWANAGPIDPVQIDIRHHHNGQTRVSAQGGRGTKLGIRSGQPG